MRAVRAARAALPARPAGFLCRALEVAGFPAFFDVAAFPEVVGFFATFAFAEVEEMGFVLESAEDCPATGSATSRTDSNPATQRVACREAKCGEDKTLMSSLYAAFARTQCT
jgi:hypothetical protein